MGNLSKPMRLKTCQLPLKRYQLPLKRYQLWLKRYPLPLKRYKLLLKRYQLSLNKKHRERDLQKQEDNHPDLPSLKDFAFAQP